MSEPRRSPPRARNTSSHPGDRRRAGDWGERLAACFLEGLGYEVLERNRRFGPLEIDLLVSKDDVVAIVEVRLRSDTSRGRPEESVSWRKRRHLERAWRRVAVRHRSARWVRMDIVAVRRDGAHAVSIRHFPNAWIPTGLGPF